MNDDQRTEAVEELAQARHDRDGGVLAWKDCHDVYRDQLRKDARLDLDALTKPRTEDCVECSEHRRAHLTDGHWHDSCPMCRLRRKSGGSGLSACSCSGSGTVTRGPIAVLVPPDAVYVDEGWWHPNVKSGQVHDHTSQTPQTMHRLCEPVYTRRTGAG